MRIIDLFLDFWVTFPSPSGSKEEHEMWEEARTGNVSFALDKQGIHCMEAGIDEV